MITTQYQSNIQVIRTDNGADGKIVTFLRLFVFPCLELTCPPIIRVKPSLLQPTSSIVYLLVPYNFRLPLMSFIILVQEALKDPRWRKAMNEEMKALKKNSTWEVVDLPEGKIPIGCSVYGVPPGCNQQTKGNKQVCKLRKSLYGLKQSPRVWFGRFTSFMKSIGYKQSNSDHTLFLKHNKEQITTLIVYVDDMIVTRKDFEERKTLQEHLAHEFEMKTSVN
ncbi:Retrovirus-related Pol polyprotein from transposon RE1 [Vitis vinifera]|uniref:Retrovirus-related Pol polyprotein from transposon RE1 n=1 Tax=Vitis vinifera TaxID=29760 RepID=A0A438CN35_VITVI|nr:Retrovirus-related Pol polyprotein from transposon RE1 [Vitis vinifera]